MGRRQSRNVHLRRDGTGTTLRDKLGEPLIEKPAFKGGGPFSRLFNHAQRVRRPRRNGRKSSMNADTRDAAQGQEPDSPLGRDGVPSNTDGRVDGHPPDIPRPLKAIRGYCLWCSNGSAQEVKLCPARSCPLWVFRFGCKPTEDLLEEAAESEMYPWETKIAVAKFFEDGGTRLDAIRRRCLDCQGNSQAEVRKCRDADCALHPYRMHENPNRKLGAEQREKAAARLKANISRRRDGK